jgi:phosphate starvation-inducible protein PhoH
MTQQEALDILKMGHHVFLTGEAGTGKTYVLNQYISWLREHDVEPAVTASTGIAATHLDGVTIHSWSGIGVR